MNLRRHGTILFQGFAVVAPLIITGYVVVKMLSWLDLAARSVLEQMGGRSYPGLGVLFGLCVVYLVGLLARHWAFRTVIRWGERLVARIPLVKSLYSAIKDLLQFMGGARSTGGIRPAMLRTQDGSVAVLGLVTQEQPARFLPGAEGKVAMYLPMSYQLGGFTVYVPRQAVQELEGLSVEDLLKLCLTAGVGAPKPAPPAAEQPAKSS